MPLRLEQSVLLSSTYEEGIAKGDNMIVHIALFAFKGDQSPAAISEALLAVRNMKDKVPGLIEVRCGENFSRWNEGFTHAVIVLAKDRDALERYRSHPDHVAVGKQIDAMEIKSIGFDFED
jgi:hypothetical protein